MSEVQNVDFDTFADTNYTPSKWSRRLGPNCTREDILLDYDQQCRKGAEKIYAEYGQNIITRNYGSRSREAVEIVCPESSTVSHNKMFVFIHGGYWQEGFYKHHSMHLALPLITEGYYFAAIGYNDSEQLSLSDIVEQISSAMSVVAQFSKEVKLSSVVLAGHSAGAHLAAMMMLRNCTTWNNVKGYIFMSGVYDLRPLLSTSINISALKLTRDNVAMLSPLLLLQSEEIPSLPQDKACLIIYGEEESDAFKEQSSAFEQILETRKVKIGKRVAEHGDHFNLITRMVNKEDPTMLEILAFMANMP